MYLRVGPNSTIFCLLSLVCLESRFAIFMECKSLGQAFNEWARHSTFLFFIAIEQESCLDRLSSIASGLPFEFLLLKMNRLLFTVFFFSFSFHSSKNSLNPNVFRFIYRLFVGEWDSVFAGCVFDWQFLFKQKWIAFVAFVIFFLLSVRMSPGSVHSHFTIFSLFTILKLLPTLNPFRMWEWNWDIEFS